MWCEDEGPCVVSFAVGCEWQQGLARGVLLCGVGGECDEVGGSFGGGGVYGEGAGGGFAPSSVEDALCFGLCFGGVESLECGDVLVDVAACGECSVVGGVYVELAVACGVVGVFAP